MRFARDIRGSLTPLFAIGAALLIALIGAAFTLNQMGRNGGNLQDAVDGAALNTAILLSRMPATTDGAASEYSSRYVRDNADVGSTPTVDTAVINRSPIQVQVAASARQSVLFGSILGTETAVVGRRAVAQVPLAEPLCMLVLAPSLTAALTSTGSARVQAPQCSGQVNSTASRAVQTGGGSSLHLRRLRVSGPAGGSVSVSPTPEYQAPPFTDPLASRIVWPAPASCQRGAIDLSGASQSLTPASDGALVICGGISLSNGAVLTLAPGVYILRTGDLRVRSNSALRGSNVTIVLLADDALIDFGSGGEVTLSAPTSGPWAYVALAVKPQSRERMASMDGGAGFDLDGIVYLPTQRLRLTGGGALERPTSGNRVFAAYRLELAGNGRIFLNADAAALSMPGTAVLLR